MGHGGRQVCYVVVGEHTGNNVQIWSEEFELAHPVPWTLHGAASEAGVMEPRADKHTLEHRGPKCHFSRPLAFVCALSQAIDLNKAYKTTTIFPFEEGLASNYTEGIYACCKSQGWVLHAATSCL